MVKAGQLVLAIGNSRLHWGWCDNSRLQASWDTPHLTPEQIHHLISTQFNFPSLNLPSPHPLPSTFDPLPHLTIASVVPTQTALWQNYAHASIITLADIPLSGLYSTLGIDRALALLGAVKTIGCPILVVDGGTALTFTGVDESHRLVGGAILPGVALQLRALATATAISQVSGFRFQISDDDSNPYNLKPETYNLPRWAMNTEDAMRSGVLFTVLAGIQDFIQDWWSRFPSSAIVLTGGDSLRLFTLLQAYAPDLTKNLQQVPDLVLQGLSTLE